MLGLKHRRRTIAFVIAGIFVLTALLTLNVTGKPKQLAKAIREMDWNNRQTNTDVKHINNLPIVQSTSYAPDESFVTKDAIGPVQVLLLTYMRSGSSLTGDILQHTPGAFYIYEPLRSLGHKNSSTYIMKYVNGRTRKPPYDYKEEAVGVLKNWFTCNISNLYIGGLMDPFLNFGLKSKAFQQCYGNLKQKLGSTSAMQICATELQKICEESPIRIIKTIRMEISAVKVLLEELPNLKIVHLVRDPRATLFSQRKFGRCAAYLGGIQGCTNSFCTRVENDVFEEERILEKHPEKIMPVFYENIAQNPLEAAEEMYTFCGAVFTKTAKDYIFNITMAGNANNCGICTVRSNSSEHIDTWKQYINDEFLSAIQSRCNYVLKRYGYKLYNKDK